MSYVKKRYSGRARRGARGMGDTISTGCTYDPCAGANPYSDAQACMLCQGSFGTPGSCSPTASFDGCGNPINTSQDQCLQAGNAATAQLDQQTKDLAQNWAPTGVYAPSDINTIVANMQVLISQAQQLGTQAMAQPGTNASVIQSMLDMINSDASQAANYTAAAASAGASGTVNAPNLKQWVLNTMTDASNAITTAASESCNAPWWAPAVSALGTAASAVWSGCKAVAGLAVAAGKVAVDAAETAYGITRTGLDVISWVTQNPLIAAAGALGVWWAFKSYKKKRPELVAV